MISGADRVGAWLAVAVSAVWLWTVVSSFCGWLAPFLLRSLDWLADVCARQHGRTVRVPEWGAVLRVRPLAKHERRELADAEQCAKGNHPAHRVSAVIDGQYVVPGDEWKGEKPAALLVDIRCDRCGAFTGELFAIRQIPLDDRLGTKKICQLVNPGTKPLTVVLPTGIKHDMMPESTPDGECDPPVDLWAKRRK